MLVLLKDISITPVPVAAYILFKKMSVCLNAPLWTINLGISQGFLYILNIETERKVFLRQDDGGYIYTCPYPQRCVCFK